MDWLISCRKHHFPAIKGQFKASFEEFHVFVMILVPKAWDGKHLGVFGAVVRGFGPMVI